MPYLNLHLTSDKPIAKQDITNSTNLKTKWTQKQLLALETIHELNNPKRIVTIWSYATFSTQASIP